MQSDMPLHTRAAHISSTSIVLLAAAKPANSLLLCIKFQEDTHVSAKQSVRSEEDKTRGPFQKGG